MMMMMMIEDVPSRVSCGRGDSCKVWTLVLGAATTSNLKKELIVEIYWGGGDLET